MSWYKKGDAEVAKAMEEKERVRRMMIERSVPWFRLRTGEAAKVIVIDDTPFFCEVHTLKIGGRWANITCSAGMRPCPICLQEVKRPQPIMFITVLDLRSYTRDDGTVVKYRKVLLPAKSTLAGQLLDAKKEYGGLVGTKLTLKRYSEKEAACGVLLSIELKQDGTPKRYNLASLGKEYATPFDYEKVLAPPTNEELEYMGFTVAPIVGDSPIEEILDEEVHEDTAEEMEEAEEVEDILEDEEEEEEEAMEIEEGSLDALLDDEEESEPPKKQQDRKQRIKKPRRKDDEEAPF